MPWKQGTLHYSPTQSQKLEIFWCLVNINSLLKKKRTHPRNSCWSVSPLVLPSSPVLQLDLPFWVAVRAALSFWNIPSHVHQCISISSRTIWPRPPCPRCLFSLAFASMWPHFWFMFHKYECEWQPHSYNSLVFMFLSIYKSSQLINFPHGI